MPPNESLEELFHQALECAPEEREQFLSRHCQNDPQSMEELRRLLASDHDAANASFWSGSAAEAEAIRTAQLPDARIGQTLGPYRMLERIGSGGMGAVYLAARDDAEFYKRVAVKVIKRGMDTDLIVHRFRTERQILAHLEHPNIARLLDGGTTEDGLPYLVMEYVEGQPLDQYADEHKLSTTERLRLFLAVCSAVQYAHQNLVIHRDLKPSNILVTREGVPKLLDFGVAKLLSPEDAAASGDPTMTVMSFLTPEYASPEQVRGEPISTLSDVYSLGVLLYQLLTGHRPYRFKTRRPEDIANAICQQQPEKPSKMVGRLRGDLDNIILMALRKEPERRYSSVEQFSDDIRHHLDGRPVIAHSDTLVYRASKFVRRHAIVATAAALLVISLLGGITVSTWQTRLARIQRNRAERRFADVRKLATSLLFEFHDSVQQIPGTLAARQLLVKRALEYLDSLAQEAGDDKSLQKELSAAYDRLGSLTFDVSNELDAHRKAMAINERLVNSEPANRSYREQLSLSYGSVANALKEMGDSPAALDHFRKSASILESLAAADPKREEYKFNLAEADDWIGVMLARLGQNGNATGYHFKALSLREPLVAANPDSIAFCRALMTSYLYIADRLAEKDQALDYIQRASEIAEALNAREPANVVYQRDLWSVSLRRARSLNNRGDATGALMMYRKALSLIEQLSLADPGDLGHRRNFAATCLEYARVLDRLNRTSEALAGVQKAIALSRTILTTDPNKTEARLDLATGYGELGGIFLTSRTWTKAADNLEASRTAFEAESKRDPKNDEIQRALAEVNANIARLPAAQLRPDRPSSADRSGLASPRKSHPD